MCGIAGIVGRPQGRERTLGQIGTMMDRIRHRGPDGEGCWVDPEGGVGFGHVRLAVIDVSTGAQPMASESGCVITYNGEVYNYLELRDEIGAHLFRTTSDTEVVLRAYDTWGEACVERLRGMFAFAIWDPSRGQVFLARDRFGIKPLYFTSAQGLVYFASETKALMPLLPRPEPDLEGLHEYFAFQFCLGDKTMFAGVKQVRPAHCGWVSRAGDITLRRYWDVQYDIDTTHGEPWFVERLRERLADSVRVHLRSDVEVGAAVSGGIDSSVLASLARECRPGGRFLAFTGKFRETGFDESSYARTLARERNLVLHEVAIDEDDFVSAMPKVIYHLDQPTAGPGSFPQYMVAKTVREHLKVVLGGQGGDEIFGGYARYLIAYWEQCIKGALDGTMDSGRFIVTYQSIIPNLQALRNYKPLIQEFWSDGIFDERDQRYFRLIKRSNTLGDIVDADLLSGTSAFDAFREIYWGSNVGKESYFDAMTHFDFKTLLPALLHVEDRMGMAHGVESRVPFLDHELVELTASIPADIKFQGGALKRLLRVAFADTLPAAISGRQDKMGFPVPLQSWMKTPGGRARAFVLDTFRSQNARSRFYFARPFDVETLIDREGVFSRNLWALLSLELWQQQFFDLQTAIGR